MVLLGLTLWQGTEREKRLPFDRLWQLVHAVQGRSVQQEPDAVAVKEGQARRTLKEERLAQRPGPGDHTIEIADREGDLLDLGKPKGAC